MTGWRASGWGSRVDTGPVKLSCDSATDEAKISVRKKGNWMHGTF